MNSLLLCIPFAGLLLCIAVMPLVKPEWWEKHQALAVIVWSLLFIIPSIVLNGAGETTETVLECIVNDYLTFIVLLFGLFCVSGNITLEGNLAGSPAVNALFLAFGTLLSSCIGTTGASMLLVRPMIKMNSWRKNKAQIMIFFIFMISNMGGCLTPIGDPPLLMGFMRGVPFFWSLHLFPILIFNMILLLIIFYLIDKKQYRKDIANGLRPDISKPGVDIKVEGLHNVIFLVAIVVAVILSGTLPSLPMFQDAAGSVLGITIYKSVKLTFPAIIEVAIILLAALLSFKTTNEKIRTQNHFTWGAIKEVAVLFIGIFITMQPALALLKTMGPNLGITEPYEMFWATGTSFQLSWITHQLTLYSSQQQEHLDSHQVLLLQLVPSLVKILMAISCGAVFMGANTYIGNAPNFMVKSISDENGIRMPSFFGYMGWSLCILVPAFFIDMLVFFL